MSSDTDIRRAYVRATDDAPPGPDLAEVLALGRGARRRRTRARVAGAVGVAAVLVAAGVLAPRLAGSDDVVAPAAPPAATDHVAGTDVDETMVSAVAAHLPGLGQPRDVFASSVDHNGPMPDRDFATATDWQAEYDVDGDGYFRLMLTHTGPDVAPCDDCLGTDVPGGRIGVDQSQSLADFDADHPWVFRVVFQGDDGRIVIATEKVAGASVESATERRVFTDAQLAELVQDPNLTFPRPAG